MRKVLILCLIIILLYSTTTNAFISLDNTDDVNTILPNNDLDPGVGGGGLTYWESDMIFPHIIGYDPLRYLYRENLGCSVLNNTDFNNYVNHGISEWNRAGLRTINSSKSMATVKLYAGSEEALKLIGWDIRSNPNAPIPRGVYVPELLEEQAVKYYYPNAGTAIPVYNYKHIKGLILVSNQSLFRRADKYRAIITHELGHAYGWRGHSTNSNDVMYPSNSYNYILTSRKIRHLIQNYK